MNVLSRASGRPTRLRAIVALMAVSQLAPVGAAQEAATPHPAHIHSGACQTLGDVVAPLSDVAAPKVVAPPPSPAIVPAPAPAPAPEPAKTDAKVATPKPAEPPKADATKVAEAKPALPPATLVFAVSPWGEIFVNGKSRGVTPPMKSLKLDPGKYKIEIRNTTFPAYAESLDLKARDEITVRYKFQ